MEIKKVLVDKLKPMMVKDFCQANANTLLNRRMVGHKDSIWGQL